MTRISRREIVKAIAARLEGLSIGKKFGALNLDTCENAEIDTSLGAVGCTDTLCDGCDDDDLIEYMNDIDNTILVNPCQRCGGKGKLDSIHQSGGHGEGSYEILRITCSVCKWSGPAEDTYSHDRKDVLSTIVLAWNKVPDAPAA